VDALRGEKVNNKTASLACAMLGINEERLLSEGMLLGPLLENFIITEIRKVLAWSVVKPKMYYLRTLPVSSLWKM